MSATKKPRWVIADSGLRIVLVDGEGNAIEAPSMRYGTLSAAREAAAANNRQLRKARA